VATQFRYGGIFLLLLYCKFTDESIFKKSKRSQRLIKFLARRPTVSDTVCISALLRRPRSLYDISWTATIVTAANYDAPLTVTLEIANITQAIQSGKRQLFTVKCSKCPPVVFRTCPDSKIILVTFTFSEII